MQSNISDTVTVKLSDVERAAEELSKNSNVQNIGNLKKVIKEFFDYLPELSEKCEPNQTINVIDLFYLFCTKYSFDTLLNTNINYQLKILYFKAFLLQSQWVLDQLSECLLEMENVFESELCIDSKDFFDQSSQLDSNQKQIIGKHSLKKLNYALLYIECLLQHAALLSQKNENFAAKLKAEQCHKVINTVVSAIDRMADVIVWAGPENFNHNSGVKIKSVDMIKYIKFLKDFTVPDPSEDDTKWSLEIAQWKLNKDLTDKLLIKKIEGPIAGRMLKQKIDKEWCSNFHISNVVKMSTFKEFDEKLALSELSEEFVLKLVLMYACCIFSLAAENRFIVKKEIEVQETEEKKVKTRKQTKNPQPDYSQEFKLQKSRHFIYSEKIHMKAIELLLFGFDCDIKLIKHLLSSYKKNYSFNIVLIEEVDEPSFSTARNSEYFDLNLQNFSINESSNIDCVNELNKRLTQLIDRKKDNNILVPDSDKNKCGDSDRQTPINSKNKIALHKLKLDIKDLSPKFYKNLNPKFLTKTTFSKKQNAATEKNMTIHMNGDGSSYTQTFSSNRDNKIVDTKKTNGDVVGAIKYSSNHKQIGNLTEPLNKQTTSFSKEAYMREVQKGANRSNSNSNRSINLTTEERQPLTNTTQPKNKFSSKFTKLLAEMNEDLKKSDDGRLNPLFPTPGSSLGGFSKV